MKILQVIPYFCFGGAETMCENLTYGLTELGHQVVVVSLYGEKTPISERMEEKGIRILYLDKKFGLDISMVPKLRKIMQAEKPAVVHTHLDVIKYAVAAAKLSGIRNCIHTVHNVADKEAEGRIQKIINTVYFKLGWSRPVALSPQVKQTVVDFYGLPDKDVPVIMIPLIFVGTVITHMLGGSAGREGAALQLGGSMGYNMGKVMKQKNENLKLFVSAGMSSVFSALFGTPFTATVFSLEVTRVGMFNFCGLFPGVISSLTAYFVALFFKVSPVRFTMASFSGYEISLFLKVAILALLCAGVCIVFATALHKTEHIMEKCISNSYIRAIVGGLLIVLLTVLLGTTDYNSVGMHVIERAVSGSAKYEAFLLKIIFTAITVAAGFKGGEIVPTFFIGATFGCVVGSLLGIGAGFGASLGFVALFSGMTKCPVAAFILALEVFGIKSALFFAIVATVTFFCSGNFGLYGKQKIKISNTFK